MATGPPPDKMTRFDLPGLNLPLNFTPHSPYVQAQYMNSLSKTLPAQGEGKNLFRTALNDADIANGAVGLRMTTLRELTMLHLMDTLTDKEGWGEKVLDDAIAEKWKVEAMATEGRDVSQKMVDFVIDELRFKATIFKKEGLVSVFQGDVVKSDNAITADLKHALKAAVLTLEADQEGRRDYHPGSDDKVVDLVHPSLFPLTYGRSRVLPDVLIGIEDCIESCGKGITLPIRPDEEMELDRKHVHSDEQYDTTPPYSQNYQWLPCEVEFGKENEDLRITSYINNLHPQTYNGLYDIIAKVITKAIPLWNHTLTPLSYKPTLSDRLAGRIKYTVVDFDPDSENPPDDQLPPRQPGESYDDYEERLWRWRESIKIAIQPEPEQFKHPTETQMLQYEANSLNLQKEYAHRGLQVIVKLASIELTPEKPRYEGGTWHVEGQLNEHICATALYYYDVDNITPSRLAFRQQCVDDTMDIAYPQSEDQWLTQVYGLDANGPMVQEVGSVLCREGRLLTFPNILQHRVEPFELADKTKNGHRKILALFLVDPGIRIISTANVPPQQKEWWSDVVLQDAGKTARGLGKLSMELKQQIVEDVDEFPIGMEEAKEIRLELMEERRHYVVNSVTAFESTQFSLCEH